jgi:hypothetical protein
VSNATDTAGKSKKNGWYSRWLRRLAEVNTQEFGGQPPSCCEGEVAADNKAGQPSASGHTGGSAHRPAHKPHH